MYDDRLMAENTLSEQRQVEEEKVTMRNEVLMRYNESLREVTTATKQINDKVQWLSSSLGTKFTALEHAKDGKVDAHSIENLKRQVVILKVCIRTCTFANVNYDDTYVCIYVLTHSCMFAYCIPMYCICTKYTVFIFE